MRRILTNRRPERDDEGAAAVEFALILTPLLLLLFGIIEFSLVFGSYQSTISSVRNAARTASAEPRVTSFAQDTIDSLKRSNAGVSLSDIKEVWIYEANADGYPLGQTNYANCAEHCIKYTVSGGNLVPVSGSWPASSISACPGDRNSTAVGVLLRVNHTPLTGGLVPGIPTEIDAHSVMRFEPIPSHLDNGTTCS